LWFDPHPALAFCLSMIFSENRIPLFRIMLERAPSPAGIRRSSCVALSRKVLGIAFPGGGS
jgi:hypothetical protein